jgi:hypothetical protein
MSQTFQPGSIGREPTLRSELRRRAARLCEHSVRVGVPPGWFDWRWVREETVAGYFARGGAGSYQTLQPAMRATNPLPRNIVDLEDLPGEVGWWGFSMRDVPRRASEETFRATLPDCLVVAFTDPEKNNFYPAIINRDSRALYLREVAFKPRHRAPLSSGRRPIRIGSATWIAERVYHNHSHWLTAHLPKLCLLQQRGELGDLVLPKRRTRVMDDTLTMLGIDLERVRAYDVTHETGQPLAVERLTVLGTDRFRPELLQLARSTLAVAPPRAPWRHVFISRARSRGRKLCNEQELTPLLREHGFETVLMEDLNLAEQIRLMGEAAVVLAPHGAGLTNMLFCAPGTQIIEIAELTYPNPNFYAMACALQLDYWLVQGSFVGGRERHPLDRDLSIDPAAVRRVLRAIGV